MTALPASMPLRQRLLVRLLFVLGVSLLLAGALAYLRSASKLRTELHAALTVGEQVLLDAVKEIDRSPSPYQQLRIVIERFSGGRHLKVTLIDAAGNRVATSRIEQPDEPAPEWFYHSVGGEAESVQVKLPERLKGYAYFLLEADPRNEVQEVWEEMVFGFFVVTALSGLAGGFVYRSIGRELKPLDDLNAALSRVASGDFNVRVGETGSADLRAVGKGFNDMVTALEESRITTVRLEEQLASVQEEERADLARDLHDEIGPLLFSVSIDASEAKMMLTEDAHPEIHRKLEVIRDSVRRSQKHVLRLLGRLRNGSVEDLGLEGAVAQLLEFWRSRQPQVKMTTRIPEHGVGPRLDPVVYRVIQESISNAIRHGRPSVIDVSVALADGIHVVVQDDGGGLKTERVGNGLTGMRERVGLMRGVLDVRNSSDGKGVVVSAHFPVESSGELSVIENVASGHLT